MPKSGPATRIVALAKRSWLSTKSGSLARHAANNPSSKPVWLTRLRYTAGMIWSVSTLLRRSGMAWPVWTVNLSIAIVTSFATCLCVAALRRRGARTLGGGPGLEVGGTGEVAGHGGSRRDERRDEVGAAAFALSALEVAIRRGGAALARGQLVGVHAETHGTSGASPLGAGRGEDGVEALRLGLCAHPHRARHDEHPDPVGDAPALDHPGHGAEILDAAVRAGADEHCIDLDVT